VENFLKEGLPYTADRNTFRNQWKLMAVRWRPGFVS
jgi:hypothetical protein